ncbi:MAG TPA: stage II sporulation protein R [Bacilli bacterium]
MFNNLSIRPYYYIAFAIIILISCWESNLTNAAVIEPLIPQESIRLRILANSDSPEDQMIKRRVRDEIINQMNVWVKGPQGMEQITRLEDARKLVQAHLQELHLVVGELLERYGHHYDYKIELATVPFPVKVYGSQVYPAGDYEAVRVTLGKGQGLNWWCVLYPPLCFVSFSSTSDAITGKKAASLNKDTHSKNSVNEKEAVPVETEVKFIAWEAFKGMNGFIKGLF